MNFSNNMKPQNISFITIWIALLILMNIHVTRQEDEINFIDFNNNSLSSSNNFKNLSLIYKINNETMRNNTTTLIDFNNGNASSNGSVGKLFKSKTNIKKTYEKPQQTAQSPLPVMSIKSSSTPSFRKIGLNNDTNSSYKDIPKEKSEKSWKIRHQTNNKDDSLTVSNNLLTINPLTSNISSSTIDVDNNFDGKFQIIIKLFNHFYWQSMEIRKRVSVQCGNDIDVYLMALKGNIQWAQKAFDSSGHYRGQIFFRNVIWIGEKMFCEEINSENEKSKDKHLELGFFAARFLIQYPGIIDPIIQLGQCLPKACTSADIETILNLDPHAKILQEQQEKVSMNGATNSGIPSSKEQIGIKILDVRRIPGEYSFYDDIIFRGLCGLCLILFGLVLIATIYEAILSNSNKNGIDMKENKDQKNIIEGVNGNSKKIKVFSIQDVNGNPTTEVYHLDVIKQNNNFNNNNNNPTDSDNGNLENNNKLKAIESNENQTKKLKIHQKLLLCFSLESNGSTILSMNKNEVEDNISCIHGIRVLSLFWIIMVHTYLQVFQIGENRYLRNISEKTLIYEIVGNATFSVDSFFFISGLLVCLLFLKHHKSSSTNSKEFYIQGVIQSFVMIIYRYIRLTPTYLFIILFHHITVKYVFNNSVFYYPTNVVDHVTCSKYWWRNILYINNWYPFKDLCMIWSWYLSNDMQFYIMATILLIFSTRYFKATVLVIGTILLTSWGTSGIFSLYYNYTHKVSNPFESFDYLYDKPWQRIGPYIMGMVTGYIIYKYKNPPKISTSINLLFWTISIAMNSILIFGVWKGQLDLLLTAFYVSVGHSAWAFGLVWITLSCCWKLSNPINTFLSYRGFLPLSRLTYCMYLIHPTIMMVIANHMQGPIHLDHLMIFIIFLGNIVITFLTALIISLFFEAPIIRLLKIIFSK